MKKTISILLIVTMLLSVILTAIPVGVFAAEGSAGGSTTTPGSTVTVPTKVNGLPVTTWEKPWESDNSWIEVPNAQYLIDNRGSMEGSAGSPKKYYLSADITMPYQFSYEPIGNIIFDGNGHTITYLTDGASYGGFSCSNNVEIRNVILKGKLSATGDGAYAPIGGHTYSGGNKKITLKNVWCDVDTTISYTGGSWAGGIVGNATDGSSFTDVIFTGSITKTDGSGTQNVGGIVGYTSGTVTFTRCFVTTAADGVVPVISTGNSQTLTVGGLVGWSTATVNLTDCGTLATLNTAKGDYVGGLVGADTGATAGTYKNCENGTTINSTTSSIYVGGFAGQATGRNFINCTNKANVNASGKVANVGGMIGYNGANFTDCLVSGNVTVNATIYEGKCDNWLSVGGIVGRSSGVSTYSNCKVTGTVAYGSAETPYSTPNLFIGGFTGIANGTQTATNCQSLGNVTVNGKPTGSYCAIGGYNGWSNAALNYTNCVRGGTLEVNMNGWKATDNSFGIGGFIGYTNSSSLNNCATAVGSEVKVTLSRASDCTTAAGVGGIYGRGTGTVKNTTNNAAISAYGYVDGVGGIIGYTHGGNTIQNVTNNGKVVTYGDAEGTGGIIGLNGQTVTITSTTNNGDVESIGTKNLEMAVGGMIGKAQGSDAKSDGKTLNSMGTAKVESNGDAIFNNCANNGNVKVETTSAKAAMVAGFVGENDGRTITFNGCTTADGKTISVSTGADNVHIAGFCSYSWGTVQYNATGTAECVNNADIVANGNVYRVGGLSGWQASGGSTTIKNAINKGDITVAGNSLHVAGIIANTDRSLTMENVTNEGNITLKGNLNNLGGIIGFASSTTKLTNVINKGDLTAGANKNTDWLCIGGISARKNGTHTYVGVENHGDINFEYTSTIENVFGVGGIIGVNNGETTIIGSTNRGDMKVEGSNNNLNGIGGFVGWNNHKIAISYSINDATIDYKGNVQFVGGFYGYNSGDAVAAISATNVINMDTKNGKGITVEYTGTGNIHVGGILGYNQHTATALAFTNVVNAAPISAKGGASQKVGGIVGIGRVAIVDAVNSAKITGSISAGILGEGYQACELGNAVDLASNRIYTGANVAMLEDTQQITLNYAGSSDVAKKNVDKIIAAMDIYAFYTYDRLEETIAFAQTKLDKEDKYLVSSWETFMAALEAAEEIAALDKGDLNFSVGIDEDTDEIVVDFLSQSEVNKVYNDLKEAIEGLINKNAIPAHLEKVVAEAEKFVAENTNIYFEEYWFELTKAINEAKILLANPDIQDMDGDYINSFAVAIQNAMKALKDNDATFGGYIYNADDFAAIEGKKGTFYLMADITVTKALKSFEGIIYGNGHTITLDGCGLFESLKAGTSVASRSESVKASIILDLTIAGDAGEAKSIFGMAIGNVGIGGVVINVAKVSVATLFDSADEDSVIAVKNVITRTEAKYALVGEVECEIVIEDALAMGKAEALVADDTVASIANAYLAGVEYYTAGVAPIKKTDVETFASGVVAYNINEAFGEIILVQVLGSDTLPTEGKASADASNVVVVVNGEFNNDGTKIDTGDIPVKTPAENRGPNLEELTSAIAIAEGLIEDLYTEESWAALQAVLANAKKALESDEQAVIDQAFNALTLARVSLDKKLPTVEKVGVSYTALNQIIDAVKALKAEDYTEDSWAALTTMLAIAETAKTAEDQASVNAARSALSAAMINLTLAPTEAPKADVDVNTDTAEDDGCGSVVGTAAIALVAVMALGAGVSFKKKED